MYSPYNPYQYLYPGQQMQQPQFQPQSMSAFAAPQNQPTAAPQQQAGPDWVQVPEIKQVEQVQVSPGSKAWVMVQNQPVFALRVADQMGLVNTSYYRFEKIDPAAMTAPADRPEYVTREEFDRFVASLRAPIAEAPAEKEAVV